jgi:hypothetical protein
VHAAGVAGLFQQQALQAARFLALSSSVSVFAFEPGTRMPIAWLQVAQECADIGRAG